MSKEAEIAHLYQRLKDIPIDNNVVNMVERAKVVMRLRELGENIPSLTREDNERERKKAKQGIFKKLFSGVGDLLGTVLKGVGKLPGIDQAKYLPLAPFKRAMKKGLSDRNISSGNKLKEVSDKFFKHVVQKEGFEYAEKADPVTISLIVSAIIGFFKKLSEKAKTPEGKALLDAGSKAILDIVNKDAQNAEQIIREEAKIIQRDVAVQSGKTETNFVPIIAVALLIFFFFWKK